MKNTTEIIELKTSLESKDLVYTKKRAKHEVRKLVRGVIWKYAYTKNIMDFDDQLLVEQVHRDYKQQIITAAGNKITQINNATTSLEVANIIDGIESWLTK